MHYFKQSLLFFLYFVLTGFYPVYANLAPVVSYSLPDASVAEGEVWTYTVPADAFLDPDGDPLTYFSLHSDLHLPYWSTFDPSTRTFTGTVPVDADRLTGGLWEGELDVSGSVVVTVVAVDPSYAGAGNIFKLTVYETPEPPLLNTAISTENKYHEAIQHSLWKFIVPEGLFIDPENSFMTYQSEHMPEGMVFDSATQTFTWTPDQAAGTIPENAVNNSPYTVFIVAYDASGERSSFDFEVTVRNVNDRPYLCNPFSDQTVDLGIPFAIQIPYNTFCDPEGDSLDYWSFAENFPAWMTFDQSTRTFSGFVTSDPSPAKGTEVVTITAVDPSWAGAQTSFNVTVRGGEIEIQGQGQAITSGDAIPSTTDGTDFGDIGLSTSASHTFTILSEGDIPLQLTSDPKVLISGTNADDFSITQEPASSVNIGENTAFTVTFTPKDLGLRTASVSIATNDDSDEALYTFAIQGNCIQNQPVLSGFPFVIRIQKPNSDWNGFVTVAFSATDTNKYTDYGSKTFTVNNMMNYTSINLDSMMSDFDIAYSDVNWTTVGQNQLTVTIDSKNVASIHIPDSIWTGSETITFTTSDTNRLTGLDFEKINVNPVDDILEEADLTLIIQILKLIEQ
jgi:hypothetical protein